MIRSIWPIGPCAAAATAALLAAAGCDAQVEPGYQGEPILSLAGTISSEAAVPDGLSIALSWVNFYRTEEPRYRRSHGSVQGAERELPGRFTLKVFERPEPWLNDFSRGGSLPRESRIGLAEVDAAGKIHGDDGSHWYAYADQMLVYVESDIRPGTVSETFTGGLLDAGFHILELVDPPCDSYLPDEDPEEGKLACLRPAPEDLDTVVRLEIEGIPDAELGEALDDHPRPYKIES